MRGCASTSVFKGSAKLSFSRCEELFAPLFDGAEVTRLIDGRAWVRAMLDVEAALARAQADVGVIPASAAAVIAARCAATDLDPADLGRRALAAGNPVVPLVADLVATLPPDVAPYAHLGATSQDILDTAAMLVAHRALGPLLTDLAGAADAAAGLAAAHRGTLLAARTLLQQAAPTTFGLKAAGWLVALDQSRASLARVRRERLAVQYGGAAGTLAAVGPAGIAVGERLAAELGLVAPPLPWHTDRGRVVDLAGALAAAAGVLGKIARDVTLLAQTEVGEVAEATPGGSSAMPHKRNPVRAVLVVAIAERAPGLAATLLAAMGHEHERAAGAWHAEWEPLGELLRLVGGAAAHVRELLGGLRVDAARMRANLDRSGGLLLTERVALALTARLGRRAARDLAARAARRAAETGTPFRDVLLAEPAVATHLGPAGVDAALDPTTYLGCADALVTRALTAHRDLAAEPSPERGNGDDHPAGP